MTDENITVVLNAMADKIRMLTWENESLHTRNEELTNKCKELAMQCCEKH